MNTASYSMLLNLWALQYDYKQVDLIYNEAVTGGFASDMLKLDYANMLTNQNKISDAERLLNDIISSSSAPKIGIVLSLLSKSYFFAIQKNMDSLKMQIKLPDDTSGIVKIGNDYRAFLVKRFTDTTDALKTIGTIYKKIPQSSHVAISYTRELVRTKQYGKADTVFRSITQSTLLSPAVLPEFAANLIRLGKDEDAMKLISNLHQHRIFNKFSLEIFRDLSYKKNLIDKAEAAQSLLEKSFKNDVSVLWSKGMIDLRSGNYESALNVFTSLAQSNPNESQFVIMKLNTIFFKGDYQKVLDEALKENVPVAFSKLISARALRKLDRSDDAKRMYEELLTIAKDSIYEPYMEYAQFLLESKESKKAADIFSKLLALYENSPKKNDAALAMILNNFAWSASESDAFDKEQVLAAAKKANSLQPENIQIMDTYATVLMKSGMYKECVAALKDSPLLKKDPSLLFHLGLAFEKSGDINRAVRTYQEIIALPDSTLGQSGKVKKAKLVDHLAVLQQ